MPDFITENMSELFSFLAGLAGGSFLTLQFTRHRVRGGGSVYDQSRSKAGGDIVGRDKTSNSPR
jgi:hypothetical protein